MSMLVHPMLSDSEKGWGISWYGEELNTTKDHHYLLTYPTKYPVYEGSMISQLTHTLSHPRYWIEESQIKNSFLVKRVKRISGLIATPKDLRNDYEEYRIVIKKNVSHRNSRTLISTILPPYSLAGNSLAVNFPFFHDTDNYNVLRLSYAEIVCLDSLLNSFVVDHILRSQINANLSISHLNKLPVIHLTSWLTDKTLTRPI
jgi:hypothetical protein